MNDWTASQIRELVSGEIIAERRLRDALRKEDNRRHDAANISLERKVDTALFEIEKASKLLFKQNSDHFEKLNHAHEEAVRVLGTYAQLRDFNDLKSRFELAVAEFQSRLKVLDEGRVNTDQRIRTFEDIQPPVALRLKDLETFGASREERLRTIEAENITRRSLTTEEKERNVRTIQRFQMLAGTTAVISIVIAIFAYFK